MHTFFILYSENIATRLFLANHTKPPLSFFIPMSHLHPSSHILLFLKKGFHSQILPTTYLFRKGINITIPNLPSTFSISKFISIMDNNHGANRPGTENHDIRTGHVLKPSKFLSALRILQLLLALAIIGLAGFVVTFIGYSGAILDLFVVCFLSLQSINLLPPLALHDTTNKPFQYRPAQQF